jgi:hypothetical protein
LLKLQKGREENKSEQVSRIELFGARLIFRKKRNQEIHRKSMIFKEHMSIKLVLDYLHFSSQFQFIKQYTSKYLFIGYNLADKWNCQRGTREKKKIL